MIDSAFSLERLERALSGHGLVLRGGFACTPDDALPDIAGRSARTLLLVGHVGGALWPPFERARRARPELGLDEWTRTVIEPLAEAVGGRALYPFQGPPFWPFQRWALRADTVFVSPVNLLIHPRYGLWHAYRAALILPQTVTVPVRPTAAHPCEACPSRPCLAACPVAALSPGKLDIARCVAHVTAPAGTACQTGCLARLACPVGREHLYPPAQRIFHMRAFLARHARTVPP
ncbi:MAG TPA: hypothetical protein VNL72_02885 [Gammaproteobacteria bacterium]|nr:hypothetical protein [Gammaproteobacteria bacterium]